MKDVAIYQYLNPTNQILTSFDREPQLVIDGVSTELPNVQSISAEYSVSGASLVTVTFIARLVTLVPIPEEK